MLIIDEYRIEGTLRPDASDGDFRSALSSLPVPAPARVVEVSTDGDPLAFDVRLLVGAADEALNDLDPYMLEVKRLSIVAECDGAFTGHEEITDEERETAAAIGAGFADWEEMSEDAAPARVPQRVLAAPKVGRNDPCPCLSGAKYKKCCGANA